MVDLAPEDFQSSTADCASLLHPFIDPDTILRALEALTQRVQVPNIEGF